MKVIVIGGTGMIGKEVVKLLKNNHDVLTVGHRDGDFQVDLGSKESIKNLLENVGKIDAIVSTAGLAKFGGLDVMPDEDFQLGLNNKLMGQVNLVRIGQEYLNEGGSITLTSGETAQNPIPGSSSISMVNGAIEGFIRAAALEFKDNKRVNAVSPKFIKETMELMGMDSSSGMPVNQVGFAYKESIEGNKTGEVLNAIDFSN